MVVSVVVVVPQITVPADTVQVASAVEDDDSAIKPLKLIAALLSRPARPVKTDIKYLLSGLNK